jgi:hypothetical protein
MLKSSDVTKLFTSSYKTDNSENFHSGLRSFSLQPPCAPCLCGRFDADVRATHTGTEDHRGCTENRFRLRHHSLYSNSFDAPEIVAVSYVSFQLPVPPAPILEVTLMGLNERRKIKELQDATLPGRVKEIEEICGQPILTKSIGTVLRMTLRR